MAKWTYCIALAVAQVLAAPVGLAQSTENESAGFRHDGSITLTQLINSVARKTGKKFVIDPKVRGEALLIGQDSSNVGFNDLLTILLINEYTAVDYGTHVAVIPTAGARGQPLPVVTGKESRPDAEFVTKIITVKNVPATHLVPIIRPMIPQTGHFAALPCVNKLILVDTFGNVKRLSAVIESLDVGEPYTPPKCGSAESGSGSGAR